MYNPIQSKWWISIRSTVLWFDMICCSHFERNVPKPEVPTNNLLGERWINDSESVNVETQISPIQLAQVFPNPFMAAMKSLEGDGMQRNERVREKRNTLRLSCSVLFHRGPVRPLGLSGLTLSPLLSAKQNKAQGSGPQTAGSSYTHKTHLRRAL